MHKYVYALVTLSILFTQHAIAAGAPRISFEDAVDPQRPPIESLIEREVSYDQVPDSQHGYFPSEWTDSDGDGIIDGSDACWETPLGDIVDSCGCPVPVHLKAKCSSFVRWCFANPTLRYDAVYFEFDSDRLDATALRTLQRFTTTLLQDRNATVRITGHADRYGPDSYNYLLSERRVDSVNTMLQSMGVSPSRIKQEWAGESERVWQGEKDQARARNRRVEMFIDWYEIRPLNVPESANNQACPTACTPLKEITDIVALSEHRAEWIAVNDHTPNYLISDSSLDALYAATDVTMASKHNDVAMSPVSTAQWETRDQNMSTVLAKELIACGMDPLRINILPAPAILLDEQQPTSTLSPYSRFESRID